MKKNHPEHTSTQGNARRRLLKATLVGGGAAATVGSLPERWAKPAIESAILPAHAQTSAEPVTGVFTATGVGALTLNRSGSRGIQYALLDALISPASANHIVSGICANDSPATIILRIKANGTVNVAVITSEASRGPCGANTTINPDNTINDVVVQLDDDEFLNLSNMVATAAQVTGAWATNYTSDDDDDAVNLCNGGFTAPKGGTFPSTNDCSLD